mmetsp:Transcript_27776/g.52343  ORF Transcript_27776/g.52343 Transcript_27776/m.52343 type:complete len:126 (-) Transcript_27776:1344-1721(-)
MLRVLISVVLACAILLTPSSAFVAPSSSTVASTVGPSTDNVRTVNNAPLSMGFFDDIFGGAKSADASHILLKGPNASKQCEKLKTDIYRKAIGKGDPAAGVAPAKLMDAVSVDFPSYIVRANETY